MPVVSVIQARKNRSTNGQLYLDVPKLESHSRAGVDWKGMKNTKIAEINKRSFHVFQQWATNVSVTQNVSDCGNGIIYAALFFLIHRYVAVETIYVPTMWSVSWRKKLVWRLADTSISTVIPRSTWELALI